MILWLRFLDYIESKYRRALKGRKYQKHWGPNWENYVRSGRKFSRVESTTSQDGTAYGNQIFLIRPEPGWEWTCQNCKTYSFIRESDMPAILKEWQDLCASAIKRGYKMSTKPTAATAGCTNCRFRPGDPE